MVNFMYLVSWAMVPRYLIEHYFGCFYKGVFKNEISKVDSFHDGRSLIHSVGRLYRIKADLPWARRNSPSLLPIGLKLHLFPGSPACRTTLQILDLSSLHIAWNNSLKSIFILLSHYTSMCVCVCKHISCWFSFSREFCLIRYRW